MTKTNESRRDKFILLLLMLLSFLFILGCSIHGQDDEDEIRYEFCPGQYTLTSSNNVFNMLYGATNQRNGSGSFSKQDSDKLIAGSYFDTPIIPSDDGMWVSDGFYKDSKDDKILTNGSYTLHLTIKGNQYTNNKTMEWNDFPVWNDFPSFTKEGNIIKIINPGISDNKGYNVAYRIKLYVYSEMGTTTRLYGQSKSAPKPCELSYDLNSHSTNRTYTVLPILVAELSDNIRIRKIMYYCPGNTTFEAGNL